MIFYGLSEQKIRTVFKSSDRREEGIAPKTAAVMKKNHTKSRKEEIWVMFQTKDKKLKTVDIKQKTNNPNPYSLVPARRSVSEGGASASKVTMISAWRYPGVSKPGTAIPIPDDIMAELEKIL